MAKMTTPKELGAATTPVKVFPKIGSAPTTKTAATAISPKAAEMKPASKTAAKPATNRLANLGAFAHPAKKKKG